MAFGFRDRALKKFQNVNVDALRYYIQQALEFDAIK
jgi:hypothetical protein